MMRKNSIFFKTFSTLLLLMLVLVSVIHTSIFFIYSDFYRNSKNKNLEMHINNLAEIVRNSDTKNYDSILDAYAKNNKINITLKLENGIKYYQGNSLFIESYFEEDSLVDIREIETVESIMIKNKTIVNKNGENIKIQLTENIQSLKEAKGIAFSLLPYSLLISVLFSLLCSYLFSKKMTKPIAVISNAVNRMNETKEDICIEIKNDDEIGKLAMDINSLYSTLLNLIENYKLQNQEILDLEKERLTFIRSTSHELKTPLAKLSILIENMRFNIGKYKEHDKYLEESMSIINELSDMITEILRSVKTTGFNKGTLDKINVEELLVDTIRNYELIAKTKNIRFDVHLLGDFELAINESNLKKALSNIISNAIKYGVEDTDIVITLDHRKLVISNEYHYSNQEETIDNDIKMRSSGVGLSIVTLILDANRISYDINMENNKYEFIIFKRDDLNMPY